MNECYVLLVDEFGSLRSLDKPFGVAVTTEEEAIKFTEEESIGFSRSYHKVIIFENNDDVLKYIGKQK